MAMRTSMPRALLALALWGLGAASPLWAQMESTQADRRPVRTVAEQRFTVATELGSGVARLVTSADWNQPLPQVKRAIVLIHGSQRSLDANRRAINKARGEAGVASGEVLIVLPQFLIQGDVASWRLPEDTLHWPDGGWSAGGAAMGPAPLSTFDVMDAILARLADRELFPALADVVVAGHSAGAQFTHRYAIVGRGDTALAAKGIRVRYVVANPSSYAYFDRTRPAGDGFTRYDAAACPKFNRWRYGLDDLPRYVQSGKKEEFEARYVAKDVWYLLGAVDTDTNHPQLDHNCGAEAQGAQRLARGQAYARYMAARHADLKHRVRVIPKAGHEADQIFRSACGLAAFFDKPGCTSP